MNADDLANLDAVALAALYAKGDVSPLEATRAALERIDRYDPAVNAFVHVARDSAEAEATASARRWGQGAPKSPLDGVPVTMKDLTEVAGMPAHDGSLTASKAPCETDAPPARMLREGGAVFLGKTNTPEFGWKAVTDNRVSGATANPWNTALTSGGSSGGAAVAAALNMGLLHQGGDSGGSIRIPGSFCGVFGLKPTFGWTPQWPPATAPSLSHIGPLTRSVRDAAMMLNVIGRYDHRDPYAVRGQPEDWGAELGNGLSGLTIAYSPDLGFATVDPDVAACVGDAVATLRDMGATVEEVELDCGHPLDVFRCLWFTASAELVSQCTEEEVAKLDPGLVADARRGEDLSAVDYFRALAARAELTHQLERFNQRYHLLMTPSVAVQPFEINQDTPPNSGMSDWEEWASFSYPFNLSQQPAATVPCGFTPAGLPVGFQIAGGAHDDMRVLRVAQAYCEACPPRFPAVPNPARTI